MQSATSGHPLASACRDLTCATRGVYLHDARISPFYSQVLRLKSVVQVLKEKLTSMELKLHKQGGGQSEEKKQGRSLFGMRRALGLSGGSKGEVSAQKNASLVDDTVTGEVDVSAGDGEAGGDGDRRQV